MKEGTNMNKSSNLVKTMCEVGLFAAIGFILDELQGAIAVSFPNGGAIGIAMVAVLIVAFRRGGLPAILTGLIMGTLDLLSKSYIYHPAQVLLDYILPYALVGCVGFLKPLFDKTEEKKSKILWLISGAVIGGMLKFLSHYLAGVFFWADATYFAWGLNNMNPYLYSLVYNIAFIGPCIILSGAVLVVLELKAPVIFKAKDIEIEGSQTASKPIYSWATTITFIVGGLTAFIWCLIRYINSVEIKPGEKYKGDQDSMLICLLGLTLIIVGVISLVKLLREKSPDDLLAIMFPIITGAATLYAIARILKIVLDDEGGFSDYRVYIYWMIITFLLCVLGVIGLANHVKQKKGEEI